MNRLKEKYMKTVAPELQKEFAYTNPHLIPRITKIVVNAGVGRAVADTKHHETAVAGLTKITGQAPVATIARHSIAGFKLREGVKIGAMVTLRGERMYEFLDRLIAVTLPAIRDFRGISETAFDRAGNYSLGIPDHTIFPEISYDEAGGAIGLQVNIVTTARTPEEGQRLLKLMGMPLGSTE